MICPECNGSGKTIYYVETDRDEYTVTIEKKDGICRTCNGSGTKPMTNADRIRAMSDEELAEELNKLHILDSPIPFCRNLPECEELLDTEDGIPDSKCKECLLEWLQQPAEEETR